MAIMIDIEAANRDFAAAKLKDDDSKSKLDALLDYANGVTGQTDSNIGDAIKTLCDGFGGGGGGSITADISYYTPDEDETVEYAINKMQIPVSAIKNTFVLIGAKNLFSDLDGELVPIKQATCYFAMILKYVPTTTVMGYKSASNGFGLNNSSSDMRGKITASNGYFASTMTNSGASSTYAQSYFPAGVKLKIMRFEF